ncbi:hypothetical protein R1flu_027778 [Riccia fluitans]|uniref:Uncharacterized protein n=1 Tax=Riccia fluitans TaxID=41844 RepID=A0ABD1XK92_9MARC
MNSGLRNKVLTQLLIWRSAEPEEGIDSILPYARRTRDSRLRKRYRLDPASRAQDSRDSRIPKSHPSAVGQRSAEPEKAINSIPPCARRTRDSSLRNLVRAGLESPGSEKGIDSILTLRACKTRDSRYPGLLRKTRKLNNLPTP